MGGFVLNVFRLWRERGWKEISAPEYSAHWHTYGGSVTTHPEVIERLAGLAGIPVRYLGWHRRGELLAAVACWGRHLALSKEGLKRHGKKRLFDMGNAEVILPARADAQAVLRQRADYVGESNAECFAGLRRQRDALMMAREPEALSKKFRYNQRREQRLLEDSGGTLRPVAQHTPAELARIYTDLFQRRWQFEVPGKANLHQVFELMHPFMTGAVAYLDDVPVAIQVLYRVEAPEWISIEYINGGVDPASRSFSPGSVLSYVNTQAAWEDARARGKTLRYSFGRADREYKERWCRQVPVFETS
jgi:CelD/BcsL family acetyltransferase involved in cellulose biosynthesis